MYVFTAVLLCLFILLLLFVFYQVKSSFSSTENGSTIVYNIQLHLSLVHDDISTYEKNRLRISSGHGMQAVHDVSLVYDDDDDCYYYVSTQKGLVE